MQDPALFGMIASQVHHTRGSSTAIILGRTVHLIGAADARAENKLRGLTAYLIALDEATLLPEEFVAQALARLSVPGAKLILTTNPGSPRHWLRQKYLLRASDLNLGHWHFTLDDNPYLDPQYVASLKQEMTGVFYARNVLGKWVAAEGAVYDMWDDDRHILRGKVPPLLGLPGVGVDYGTQNPFSAHMLGLTNGGHAAPGQRPGAKLILTREYRHDPAVALRQKTDAEFSTDLREWIGTDKPDWVAVDPSAASFKLQLFHDGLTNVVNAKNDVLDGIRLFGSLLATGRLLVHESCAGLIDEIAGYSWDPAASARGEDKPLKVDDHSCDSARYAVATTETSWRHEIQVAA
jgi:PBSX family phage terminase large subunit